MGLGLSLIAAGVVGFVVFGMLGRHVAVQKHRGVAEGFWLGGLFGPLGVLVVALLPTVKPSGRVRAIWVQPDFPERRPSRPMSPEEDRVADWLGSPHQPPPRMPPEVH